MDSFMGGLSDIQKKIVEFLAMNGPMSRGDMVKEFCVPRTTIYDNLAKLMYNNIIERNVVNTASRGRPRAFFSLKSGIVAR